MWERLREMQCERKTVCTYFFMGRLCVCVCDRMSEIECERKSVCEWNDIREASVYFRATARYSAHMCKHKLFNKVFL